MRVFVCVKPVPDTAARIKVGGDGKTIDPSGVKFILGPYDARTVAKALELKGEDGEVVVVSAGMGGKGESAANKRIKDALALGADRGIFIADEAPENRDPLAVAKALATAIQNEGGHDLVLCGRQAMDDQALAVGPMLATLLDLPCVTDAVSLEVSDGKAVVQRAAEGRVETIEVTLPALITGQRDLADERYPKLKDILKAKKKSVATFDFAWPAPAYEVVSLAPPPDPVAGKIVGEGPDAVPELLKLLQDEAKALTF
ncbi:MAG: electron transfer flavoprotein subunit beta/FixA family protein [Planctomycetes bacterium]|nr:electron transfer flavoprotein subunit beta/FixA family protein [Planctomycetota bacterium]